MAFTFEGNKEGALHLVEGDKRYHLTDKGLHALSEPGFEAAKFEGPDSVRALNDAMIHAEENAGKLSAETRAALHSNIEHVSGVEANRLTKIKEAIAGAKELEAAKDSAAIEAILKKSPLSVDFVTEAGTNNLNAKNFDLVAFQTAETKIAEQAAKVAGLNEELTKLLKAEKPDAKAVAAFVEKNQAHLADLKPLAADAQAFKLATKYDFTGAVGTIEREVAAHVTRAQALAEEIIKQTDVIKTKPPEAALKAAVDAEAAAQKELGTILEHKYAGVIKSRIPEAVMKDVQKVNPTLGAKLGTTAADTAKTAWGWSKNITPKAEGITGALWKNRGVAGKGVVVAGGATILYAIVSAIGGKGPGEHAQSVTNGREVEPAAGRA